MNRRSTLLFILMPAFIQLAGAQVSIPNGDMEDWNNVVVYKEPVGWATPNPLTSLIGAIEVEQSTDASSGSFAAKLTSHYISSFGIVVPGAMGTGKLDPLTQTFTGGFPFTGQPAALIGYYKYLPNNNDSCLMFAVLTKWDGTQRDTVAVSVFKAGNTPSYTLFTAPFFYLLPGTSPDTALVIVATAANPILAQDSSALYIDDIDFTNAVAVSDIASITLKVYPSPASEQLEVTIPADLRATRLVVTNAQGAFTKTYAVEGTEILLDVRDFPTGNYFLLLQDEEERSVAQGRVVISR